MKDFFRAMFRGGAPAAALAGAMVCGLTGGYLAWYTFVAVTPSTTVVKWTAPWIRYPLPSRDDVISQSYFRKKIYLSDAPKHGWIKVMAPDAFDLYVNGKLMGKVGKLGTNTTRYFDLTSDLQQGTNLIAVSVHRGTFPGTSEMVAEGEIEDVHGNHERIATDATWVSYPYEDWLLGEGMEWYETRFDDARWVPAVVARDVVEDDRSTVLATPTAILEAARGQWMWSEDTAALRVQLRRRFDFDGPFEYAWLRVSGEAYELLVNGVPIGGSENLMGTYGDEDRPSGGLDLYDIGPFLKRGANTIAIKGVADRLNGGIYADGQIAGRDGSVLRITCPNGWEASTQAPPGWFARGASGEGFRPASVLRVLNADEHFSLSSKLVTPPPAWELTQSIRYWALAGLAVIACIALWAVVAWVFMRLRGIPPETALALAGIPFAAPIAFFFFTSYLGEDFHFDQALAYRPWVLATGALLLVPGFLALALSPSPGKPWRPFSPKLGKWATAAVLLVLTVVGYQMRVSNLDRKPLGGDEVTMSLASRHVLTKGFPAAEVSPHLTVRPATTSEIVPYFFAATVFALPNASPEFGLRFALVIFGTGTLLMTYLLGKEMFGKPAGLLSAAMYAAMPIAINMAQFARYPQIVQFFCVVSAYYWYKAFVHDEMDHRALFWGTFFVVITYLSWEGVAFFFVAIGLGCMCLRGSSLRWLLDKWLWLAVIVLVFAAFFQLGIRFLITRPIPLIGSGIADLVPTDRWNQPLYDPMVFVRNYLAMLGLAMPSLLASIGLLFVFKNKALAYTECLLFIPLLLTTNLVEVQDFRHVYYTLPFVVLAGAAVLLDGMKHLWPAPGRAPRFSPISIWGVACGATILAFFILTTTTLWIKPYNLKGVSITPSTMLECGDDGGIREVVRVLRNESYPNDKVIGYLPHMVYFYYGKVDLYFQNPLKIPIAIARDGSYAVHRETGSAVITDVAEWKDVLSKNHRIWFVLPSKFSLSTFGLEEEPEIYDDLEGHLKLVLEDQNAWLYLWEK